MVACGGGSSSSPADASHCDGPGCTRPPADASSDGAGAHKPDGAADAASDAPTDAPGRTLDPTVASNLAFTSAFLYTGPNPVQTGVSTGTIDPTRVSVLRGQVSVHSTASNAVNGVAPIAGVNVSVVGHPEYGVTTTQSDGWFSLVVNGGGVLSVAYSMTGYLPVQRRATTRWLEYTIVNPVVLTAPEPGTPVTLSSSSTTFQVVRGATHGGAASMTPTEDSDGARTATVVIPPGTTASVAGLNNTKTTLRATEYTTGATGLQAMPADLPPTSSYTYAVDLSIDEAAGAPVTFSQPVLFYVDNFVGFPVGDGTHPTSVPAGYYDTTRSLWVPSTSGQVVKVLTNASGTVTLDTVGNGQDTPDTAFTPPLVAGERGQIAALYKAGASFWRVGLSHFSIWDLNWGKGPPDGAVQPNNAPASGNNPDDNSCHATGSIIECENQILAEEFPVTGTPFALRYQSERTAGRAVTVQIPITGSTPLPSVVNGIEVLVATQGRQWTFHSSSLAPNQTVTWTWDRTDAYGRTVSGHSDVSLQVGYDYQASSSYQATGQFGNVGVGIPITGNRALSQLTIWQYSTFPVDQIDARTTFGMGGLSLSGQQLYDPFGQTFYGGDGTRRTADGDHFTAITPYAGQGSAFPSTTAAPAASVGLTPKHLAVGPDGALYVAAGSFVVAVDPKTQLLTAVAGTLGGATIVAGGQPASSVALTADGVAVGPDGVLYVTTASPNVVCSLDLASGTLTPIAGSGGPPESCTPGATCSDGSVATGVPLSDLGGVAVGPDGCVYFSETFGGAGFARVRKIGLDGTLRTVMDNLLGADGVAFGPDGSLYVTDTLNDQVLRLTPSGASSVVAGSTRGSSGNGGPATQAQLFHPEGSPGLFLAYSVWPGIHGIRRVLTAA